MKPEHKKAWVSRVYGPVNEDGYKLAINRMRAMSRILPDKPDKNIDWNDHPVWPGGDMNTIEVEFLAPLDREVEREAYKRLKGIGVEFKCDGSVSTSGYTHRRGLYQEAVISFRDDNYGRPAAVLSYMKEKGFSVNKTCGLHVHLDARHLEYDDAAEAHACLCDCEYGLRYLIPEWTRDGREYVAVPTEDNGDEGRYVGINFHESWEKHHTIEVRLAPGTLRADIALGWAKLLNHLFDRGIESLRDVTDKTMLQWIKWRAQSLRTTGMLRDMGVAI